MVSKEDLKEKLKNKINFFSKRRNDLFMLFALVCIYNMNGTIDELVENSKLKDNYIEKISSHITYIDDNGTIKQYERETFDAFNQKNNVAKILTDYLILSAFDLTNGYKVTYFPSEEVFYKNSKDLTAFYDNFIEINTNIATENQKANLTRVKNDFKQILTYLQTAVETNSLPHTMDKKTSDINIKIWKTTKNEFEIMYTIPVFVSSNNKYNEREEGLVDVTISAKGYFLVENKKVNNPQGMYFTDLEITYPKIKHIKKRG